MTTPTIYEREVWQDPALPVTGPPLPWRAIDTVAPHYTAAVNLIDGDPGEYQKDIPAYLRAIQRDYKYNRPQYNADGVLIATGYSIGYNWAVDWLGGIWELRGWDYKCAANSGHNDHVVAILCLVDGADPVTDAAAASIRYLVAEAEQLAGRRMLIKGHRQLPAATGCPGDGIVAQINAGLFRPDWQPPTPPPVDPPVVEPPTEPLPSDDMKPFLFRILGYNNVFLMTSGGPIHASAVLYDRWDKEGLDKVLVDDHDQFKKSVLTQTGLTEDDLIPGGSTTTFQ